MEPRRAEALPALERTIAERRAADPDDSYTAELLADPACVGEKVREEAEEVARAAARASPTSGWPRRPPTCSTTCPCCWPRAASAWPTPSRCSMTVAADLGADAHASTRSRELAREHTLVPLRHTFIADTETPVSAYLKLRGDGPSFLLESAEQGQRFGRWSFLGFRPARPVDPDVSAATHAATPTRSWPRSSAATGSPRSRPAAVRRRRRGPVRLRPGAHRRADRGRAQPRRDRACPTWR